VASSPGRRWLDQVRGHRAPFRFHRPCRMAAPRPRRRKPLGLEGDSIASRSILVPRWHLLVLSTAAASDQSPQFLPKIFKASIHLAQDRLFRTGGLVHASKQLDVVDLLSYAVGLLADTHGRSLQRIIRRRFCHVDQTRCSPLRVQKKAPPVRAGLRSQSAKRQVGIF